VSLFSAQHYATAPAPEKIEVFVNDKSLLVDPGITVLQVNKEPFPLLPKLIRTL